MIRLIQKSWQWPWKVLNRLKCMEKGNMTIITIQAIHFTFGMEELFITEREVNNMLSLVRIAHYGRWFPYYNIPIACWWYDIAQKQEISINKTCRIGGYENYDMIDVSLCRNMRHIPFFRANIPEQELIYAKKYLPEEYIKEQLALDMEHMDYKFNAMIEEEDLLSDWYFYELQILVDAALKWCREKHIPFKNRIIETCRKKTITILG